MRKVISLLLTVTLVFSIVGFNALAADPARGVYTPTSTQVVTGNVVNLANSKIMFGANANGSYAAANEATTDYRFYSTLTPSFVNIESYNSTTEIGTNIGSVDNAILGFKFDFGSSLYNSLIYNASTPNDGSTVKVTLDKPSGQAGAINLATINVMNTGGWGTYLDNKIDINTNGITGIRTVYLTFNGVGNNSKTLNIVKLETYSKIIFEGKEFFMLNYNQINQSGGAINLNDGGRLGAWKKDAFVEWRNVVVPRAGNYDIRLGDYGVIGSDVDLSKVQMTINGSVASTFDVPVTATWSGNTSNILLSIPLNAGTNTIRLTGTKQNGDWVMNLGNLLVSTTDNIQYQKIIIVGKEYRKLNYDQISLSGGTININDGGRLGTWKKDGFVEWSNVVVTKSSKYDIRLGDFGCNGIPTDLSKVQVTVNNVVVSTFDVPNTSTWSGNTSEIIASIPLNAGANTIRLTGIKENNGWIMNLGNLLVSTTGSQRPEVYLGVCENYMDQINNPTQWSYVSQNADGFYANFIELDPRFATPYSQSSLNAFGSLFKSKMAIIESDMDYGNIQREQTYINNVQAAGFMIPYTSLNYGWSAVRQENLKTNALKNGQNPRLCLVQQGPWCIGGSITGDNGPASPYSNADYRSWINQADGISTDGPMGYWYANVSQMKAGSYSMVKYAKGLGKKALVMIAPYGAGVSGYDASMFLSVGQTCVRDHEDNDADPDIWSVFEYAIDIPAVPEQINGVPYNSTTGMAYYLINHIKGVANTLDLYAKADGGAITGSNIFSPDVATTSQKVTFNPAVSAGTVYHYALNSANLSSWCDYAAVLKATATGSTNAWSLSFKLGATDVTNSVLTSGFMFYKTDRLNPLTTKIIEVYITRTLSTGSTNFALNLELMPHNGSDNVDSMQITCQ